MSNQEEYLSPCSLIPTTEFSQTCNASVVKTRSKNLQPALADADKEAGLVPPITPEFDRESGECQHGLFTSSHTFVPTPAKEIYDHQSDLNDDGPSSTEKEESLCTPEKATFDPFAPGSDKFVLAPRSRKYAQVLQTSVVRRLDFEEASSSEIDDGEEAQVGTKSDDDEILLETVYGTLLEAIISNQASERRDSGKLESVPSPVPDGFKTPISAPRLSGVAETCPWAPIKPRNKFRNIDKDLCRKLEF